MILVTSCCGCVSLQKGTVVIGGLSLISAIMNAIVMGTHITALETAKNGDSIPAHGILIILKLFIVSLLIYVIVGGIFSALMIFGATKRLSGYIFPWLALSFTGVIGALCITLGTAIVAAVELPVGTFFILLLFTSASTALQIYFWQVVYSHYKEVVAEKFGHQTRPSDGKIITSPQMNPYHNV